MIQGLTQETINHYNFALGIIFTWMNLAISARKKNIVSRLAISKSKRLERNGKIEEDKQRAEDRTAALTGVQDNFEQENAADIGKYNQYQQAIADG